MSKNPIDSGVNNIKYKNHYGVTNFPRHLCLIPDGNRRWARENNIPVLKAHAYAVDNLIPVIVDILKSTDIEVITMWGLSTENLHRAPGEVNAIYDVLCKFVPKLVPICHQFEVQLSRVGSDAGLPEEIVDVFEDGREETSIYRKRKFNIALNYGGRMDIVEAVNQFITDNPIRTEIKIEDINQWVCMGKDKHCDPELIIRTGADSICLRTSGFLTWQGMNANYYFLSKRAPEITLDDIFAALLEYESLVLRK